MAKIALIGCTSSKKDMACKAVDMFSPSAYFNLRLEYCKKNNYDKIFILSSKCGLLDLNEIIEPYDFSLQAAPKEYKKEWSDKVLNDLKEKTDIQDDEYILLAGDAYTKNIKKSLKHTYNPVEGLRIGKQLHFFKQYLTDDTITTEEEVPITDELDKLIKKDEKIKYPEFNKMLQAMKEMNYDYRKNESFLHVQDRTNKTFTINDHISALIYSQLSANRPWIGIEKHKEEIDNIFHNFDVEYLKTANPEELVDEIKSIKCGNRQINYQMYGLRDNIQMFEEIEDEYGSLDNFVLSDDAIKIAKKLSTGKYKLKAVGFALACEYLKGVGIDVIKPDIHICRILGRFGYSKKVMASEKEAIAIIDDISNEYDLPKMEIDTIIWQYGARGYLEICGSEPKCHICNIKCKYSNYILNI